MENAKDAGATIPHNSIGSLDAGCIKESKFIILKFSRQGFERQRNRRTQDWLLPFHFFSCLPSLPASKRGRGKMRNWWEEGARKNNWLLNSHECECSFFQACPLLGKLTYSVRKTIIWPAHEILQFLNGLSEQTHKSHSEIGLRILLKYEALILSFNHMSSIFPQNKITFYIIHITSYIFPRKNVLKLDFEQFFKPYQV